MPVVNLHSIVVNLAARSALVSKQTYKSGQEVREKRYGGECTLTL